MRMTTLILWYGPALPIGGGPLPWRTSLVADLLPRREAGVLDWSEVAYLLARNGVAVALVYQVGQGTREWLRGRAEVSKIKAAVDADVTRIQATTQAKIAEMSAAHELQLARERDRASRPRRDRAVVRPTRQPARLG